MVRWTVGQANVRGTLGEHQVNFKQILGEVKNLLNLLIKVR